MRIDEEKCVGCGSCIDVCPMEAISMNDGVASVSENVCVECGTCLRISGCSTDAIYMPELSWPRSLAAVLSDPITEIKETQLAGRGTEEMKTNEITSRLKPGQIGFAVDVGRPHAGTTFGEVEKICMELSKLNVVFEPKNPVTILMKDKSTGEMQDDVRNVRILTAVIECLAPEEQMKQVLTTLKKVANEIDTVFSLNVIGFVREDGEIPLLEKIREAGFNPAPNGKVNLGLGRANR